MSSASLTYLGKVVTAISDAFTLQGVPIGERAWVVMNTIPGPESNVEVAQHALLDILAEGDDVLGDGSGHGVQLGLVVAVALTDTITGAGARTIVADAVSLIRSALQAPAAQCRPDKFSVAYDGVSTLYGVQVYSATIGIERKLVL